MAVTPARTNIIELISENENICTLPYRPFRRNQEMKIHIETERLILRDLEEFDAEGIFALDSDPAVHEYLGKKPISTMQQAQEIIVHVRRQYIENGIGRWAIVDKKTNDFIGWTGLKYEKSIIDEAYFDLGYRLRQKYWGQGIATETAVESLKYGFNQLGLEEICALAAVGNLGSNRVLQKVGMNLVGPYTLDGEPHHWYRLSKEDWVNQQR